MIRKKITSASVLLLGILCFLAVFFYEIHTGQKKPEFYEISVITRGKVSDRFAAIKQGVDQAAADMMINVSYITLSEDNNAKEQEELLNREVAGGADAIVLSAADSVSLAAAAEKAAEKIPVISIESPVESDKIEIFVSADNYFMGESLGNEVIKWGIGDQRIGILKSSTKSLAIHQRIEGVQAVLDRAGISYTFYEIPDATEEAVMEIKDILWGRKADILIALDTFVLEDTAQVIQEQQIEGVRLYGIGASMKVAGFLEKEIIKAIVVQNDFNIGYLGIGCAVDAIEGKNRYQNKEISYTVIDSGDMYSKENQRLLFPFVR